MHYELCVPGPCQHDGKHLSFLSCRSGVWERVMEICSLLATLPEPVTRHHSVLYVNMVVGEAVFVFLLLTVCPVKQVSEIETPLHYIG